MSSAIDSLLTVVSKLPPLTSNKQIGGTADEMLCLHLTEELFFVVVKVITFLRRISFDFQHHSRRHDKNVLSVRHDFYCL